MASPRTENSSLHRRPRNRLGCRERVGPLGGGEWARGLMWKGDRWVTFLPASLHLVQAWWQVKSQNRLLTGPRPQAHVRHYSGLCRESQEKNSSLGGSVVLLRRNDAEDDEGDPCVRVRTRVCLRNEGNAADALTGNGGRRGGRGRRRTLAWAWFGEAPLGAAPSPRGPRVLARHSSPDRRSGASASGSPSPSARVGRAAGAQDLPGPPRIPSGA